MGRHHDPAMLATLAGTLALLLGLAILLLPLLAGELSRPRDSAWGAVVLLMGLVLVTSAYRLTGAPMLGVLSAGLVIGRLGSEVGQARWRQLSEEEQQRLWSAERWTSSLGQLGASLGRLLEVGAGVTSSATGWLAQRQRPRSSGKRWVRPEAEAEPAAASGPAEAPAASGERGTAATTIDPPDGDPMCREVADFAAIDQLLEQSLPGAPGDEAG